MTDKIRGDRGKVMYCSRCGREITEGSRFCPYCGNHTEEFGHDSGEWEKKAERKNRRPVLLVLAFIGVMLLSAAVTAGAFFAFHRIRSGEQELPDQGKRIASDKRDDLSDEKKDKKEEASEATDQLVMVEQEDNYYTVNLSQKTAALVCARKTVIHPFVEYKNEKYPVTEIGDYAVYGRLVNSINGRPDVSGTIQETITIPKTVRRIGDHAFENQMWMESIEIPDSVEEIGVRAFSGTGLKRVRIPDSVKRIGGSAFAYTPWSEESQEDVFIWKGVLVQCQGGFHASDYEIPEGVYRIGEGAFEMYGEEMERVTIPSHVKEIGAWAFAGCGNLREVYIDEAVERIGGQAFALTPWAREQNSREFIWKNQFVQLNQYPSLKTYLLEEYRIPDGVEIISDYAFSPLYVEGLYEQIIEKIQVPEGVRVIGKGAFFGVGCSDYQLPATLEEIGDYAFFRSGRNLRSLLMSDEFAIQIPEGVKRIGKQAFGQCYNMGKISLPSTLQYINIDAFSRFPDPTGESMKTRQRYLAFSGLLEDVGSSSFDESWELSYVTYLKDMPNTIQVSVPKGEKKKYEKRFQGRSDLDVELEFYER